MVRIRKGRTRQMLENCGVFRHSLPLSKVITSVASRVRNLKNTVWNPLDFKCNFNQERERPIKIRKILGTPAGCPRDTRRDKQGTGRCPNYFLLITIEELAVLLGHRPGVPGTPGRPGAFQKFYVFFSYSGVTPANQTKGQFMNFSQGHSGPKVQCESCLFSQGKTPEFTKMGEIHELFVLPLSLVWFAGATPDLCAFSAPDSSAIQARFLRDESLLRRPR